MLPAHLGPIRISMGAGRPHPLIPPQSTRCVSRSSWPAPLGRQASPATTQIQEALASREPPSLMAGCLLTPLPNQKLSPTQHLDPKLLANHSCSHVAPHPSPVTWK